MVSEETSMIDRISSSSPRYNPELWLSSDNAINNVERASDVETFVAELVREICDRVCEVMPRDRQILADERSLKKRNRRTSILEDELVKPVLEFVDENDNSVCEAVNHEVTQKPKKKKKLSFSFLRRSSKENGENDHHEENYDNFDTHGKIATLRKSKKYNSAVELNQKNTKLTRTTSLLKKFGQESKNFLKRSVSVRELSRKSRERLSISEEKELEWKQSLQSLVETDVSVSYNDLSFVDYDALNDINYGDYIPEKTNIGRTQSMYEQVSVKSGTYLIGEIKFYLELFITDLYCHR